MKDYSNETLCAMLQNLENKVDDGFKANSKAHIDLSKSMETLGKEVNSNTRHRIINEDTKEKVDKHHDFITRGKVYFVMWTFIVASVASIASTVVAGFILKQF